MLVSLFSDFGLFIYFLHEQSNNHKNSWLGNFTWNFENKNTDHANILQQSDSNSITLTNYTLKNNVYGFKLI